MSIRSGTSNANPFRPLYSLTRPAARPVFGQELEARNRRIDQHLAHTETPAFRQEFANTLQKARRHIAEQIAQKQPGFVVLDIDETTLDNRGYFRDPARQFYKKAPGLASISATWRQWVQQANIPVIPDTKQFIDWLNQQKIPYCFLTGIQETLSAASIQNLKNVGVWGAQCLGAFYKPDPWVGSTRQFKVVFRDLLEKRFKLPILASLGDRPSDMTAFPEKNFLLPNYVAALRKENDEAF